MDCFYQSNTNASIPLELMSKEKVDEYINSTLDNKTAWLLSSNRSIKAGNHYLIPNKEGKVDQVLAIVDSDISMWSVANLPWALPPGNYKLSSTIPPEIRQKISIGWGLGAYRFTNYKKNTDQCARLHMAEDIDQAAVFAIVNSTELVRNLINTPANDMMPENIAEAARSMASRYQAKFSELTGNELIEKNYPLIYSVGRASEHKPRLIKIEWGSDSNPLVCLVGKGVCFDSGGLNIKSATGMRLMKKDMGGAAHVLGLAQYIMQKNLPVRLHVSIPAVENAIANNAYRPGDVIISRSGKSVEIDNTDAEGRLVLADAITDICEQKPDLLVDFATLTGAARVALGTEVGVFFSKKDSTAHDLYASARAVEDDIWRLPIHKEYKHQLKSTIADLVNCSTSGFGGAITAALFLESFVPSDCDWLHFDIMAYNNRKRPGRPKGGEAMGLRSLCHYLDQRYSAG